MEEWRRTKIMEWAILLGFICLVAGLGERLGYYFGKRSADIWYGENWTPKSYPTKADSERDANKDEITLERPTAIQTVTVIVGPGVECTQEGGYAFDCHLRPHSNLAHP